MLLGSVAPDLRSADHVSHVPSEIQREAFNWLGV